MTEDYSDRAMWEEFAEPQAGVCSTCKRQEKIELPRALCFDCAMADSLRQEMLYKDSIERHGYPHYYNAELGRTWIANCENRMAKLKRIGDVPLPILENEERLLAKRQGFMTCWLRDHPEDSV